MLKRWLFAQKAEKIYWGSREVVLAETRVIFERYLHVFSEIASRKDWRILDVGCGPTFVSRLVEGGEKFCVDPLMRFFVGKFGDDFVSSSFSFLSAVGEFLPFRDGCFDLVVCRNVLDHVASPGMVLREVRRVSRRKGFLVLGVYVYPEFVCKLKRMVERLGIAGLRESFHPHFFTREDVERMLSKYFVIVNRKIISFDRVRWQSITSKLMDLMYAREGSSSVLGMFRYFLSCFLFHFFWNIVRFLNHFKSRYYVVECVFLGVVK